MLQQQAGGSEERRNNITSFNLKLVPKSKKHKKQDLQHNEACNLGIAYLTGSRRLYILKSPSQFRQQTNDFI